MKDNTHKLINVPVTAPKPTPPAQITSFSSGQLTGSDCVACGMPIIGIRPIVLPIRKTIAGKYLQRHAVPGCRVDFSAIKRRLDFSEQTSTALKGGAK